MTPASFLKTLPEKVPGLVCLLGDSEWEKKRVIDRLIAGIGDDVDLVRFEGGKTAPTAEEIRRLLADLASASLFGSRRVIVVRDGDALWKSAGDRIVELVRSPSLPNTIVLVGGSGPGAIQQRKMGKRAVTVGCTAPAARSRGGGSPLHEWLESQARERGLALSGEARRRLLERAGTDQGALAEELDKLALFADRGATRAGEQDGARNPAGTPISGGAVDEVVADSAGRGLDGLLDAILTGNAVRTLELWRTICRDGLRHWNGDLLTGDSAQTFLMRTLADRYRKMLAVIESIQVGSEEIRVRLRVRSDWYWERLRREGRRLGRGRVEACLGRVAAAERAMRLEGRPAGEVIEETILRLAMVAGQSGRSR